MNHAEAAIPPLHKHRRLIGPGNSISWAVGSTVRYEAKTHRVSSCGPRSSLGPPLFFSTMLFPRLRNRATNTCNVRSLRCRRRAKSMQASCTICAQVNTCFGIPAARHKPSFHKRSSAYPHLFFSGVLVKSVSLLAEGSEETNEKSTCFRSLTLHTRALTCTAMIQAHPSISVFPLAPSRSLCDLKITQKRASRAVQV